jgi:FkbH-like protein
VDQRAFFKDVSLHSRQGRPAEALQLLRHALSRAELDAEGVDKAGRLCSSLLTGIGQKPAARVLVLGQCTTTWFVNALTAVAWGQGARFQVTDGAYDNVMQELLAADPDAGTDVVVLVPWSQRLRSTATNDDRMARIEDEVRFWRNAWTLATDRLSSRIVQVGFDCMTPGPYGYSLSARGHGDVALVRAANDALRAALPPGALFIDLEQISGELGRQRFYDPRRYHWTKQPFSDDGVVRLAEHVSAGIRAVVTGSKKVLVLDLDNTLWGGVVGETGALGIVLGEGPDGESFTAFQKHVKGLAERGIVLAVASKNNDADAREPFEKNPHMVLSLDDIAHFEAHWEPKAVSLKRTAETLQLGLDSLVFFDDNPAEREHIRQALPQVAVVDVPAEPADYVRALDAALWFEATDVTNEDRQRAAQYQTERKRNDAKQSFDSLDGYLQSLDMRADIRRIDDADLDRVVQLIGKTNQFNLTTRRHSASKVTQMLANSRAIGLTLRLIDRFGDHGLVSVMLATPCAEVDALEIDTWLMSCRVISRTVEQGFFNVLVADARARGMHRLIGTYAPTAKNMLVRDLYDRLGFTRRDVDADGRVRYEFAIESSTPAVTFVHANMLLAETAAR